MPRLSVIIPTYRRPEILAECLRHLERQTIASEIEVIVVSDGHDEQTASQVENAPSVAQPSLLLRPAGKAMEGKKWEIETHFFEIPKSQQGVARNKGVSEARGEYVLFIGDDIFLAPDACECHLKAHDQWKVENGPSVAQPSLLLRPAGKAMEGRKWKMNGKKIFNFQFSIFNSPAVVGFITWDPACGITPVMKWLEKSGWQFGYPAISRYAHGFIPEKIQHQFTYTSHISLPLSLAKKHPFRPDVHLYGWEDIEWGMRLKNHGVRLFYEPDAKALHHHHIELADSLKRMEILGRSAVEIAKVVPEFDRVPKWWKLPAYRLLSLLPTTAGRHRWRFLAGIGR